MTSSARTSQRRRSFTLLASWAALRATAPAAALFAAWPGPAKAQRVAPAEGQAYRRLAKPLPVAPGRLHVLAFFWYGCPHCYAFEPALQAWAAQLPQDVQLTRVPVVFNPVPLFLAHQKIYYALQALGQAERMHMKVFEAIHHGHQRLDRLSDIAALMQANGIDPSRFVAAYESPEVARQAQLATDTAQAYGVDAVPSFGVQGRYFTSATLADTPERSLVVVDYLLDKLRRGG